MSYQIWVIILMLGIAACSSFNQKGSQQKFDVPLLQKMDEIKKKGTDESIKVFGKCESEIDDKMRLELDRTGTKIETVAGNIFTGSGTVTSLQRLARLDFVSQIHLATINKPY